MANVRDIAFASGGEPSPDHPFTFCYRLNTGETWLSRGISSTRGLESNITEDFDATCTLPTRTILRTDDGSGAEISIPDILQLVDKETVLGKGRLASLYFVVYPTNPIPETSETSERVEETRSAERKSGCCALQ